MKFDPLEYLILAGVDEQTAEDWITLRKAKKAPPTATAINMLAKQAIAANITLTQALELCCMNGWQGFKAEWVAPKGQTFTDRKVDTLNQLTGRSANVVDFAQGRLINAA